MVHVRKLDRGDVDDVVRRVELRLRHDAQINDLVSPEISTEEFGHALADATSSTWVALAGDVLVGHLYGALLESAVYGHGVWIGPDAVSFDGTDVLSDLYAQAGQEWIERGALEHYVWVLDDASSTQPWYELGFARMHTRGVLAIDALRGHELADIYSLRRGTLDDLDVAVSLSEELNLAQEKGPSFSIDLNTTSERDELLETLSDPEVEYYLVEYEGRAVGQCITFPLPARRGSFDDTLHLSAVVVSEDHRGRGVATALVNSALDEAFAEGFRYVETNWRVTNRQAQHFWTSYGFRPTYVRLHRTIGAG